VHCTSIEPLSPPTGVLKESFFSGWNGLYELNRVDTEPQSYLVVSGAETLSSLNCMPAPVVMMELACVWEKRGESKGKSCMSTAVSFVNADSAGTEIGLLNEVAGRHCCLGALDVFVQ
jgi:hypothetical protein